MIRWAIAGPTPGSLTSVSRSAVLTSIGACFSSPEAAVRALALELAGAASAAGAIEASPDAPARGKGAGMMKDGVCRGGAGRELGLHGVSQERSDRREPNAGRAPVRSLPSRPGAKAVRLRAATAAPETLPSGSFAAADQTTATAVPWTRLTRGACGRWMFERDCPRTDGERLP